MRVTRRARTALTAPLPGAALLAALPGAANAGVLVKSTAACENGAVSQPFAQFGDSNSYFLAPAGNFESAARGWSIGNARVVADQEPWRVNRDAGTHALSIPAGGSAV